MRRTRRSIIGAALLLSVSMAAASCAGSAASPTPKPLISLGVENCAFLAIQLADEGRLPTILTALAAEDWGAAAAALPAGVGHGRQALLPNSSSPLLNDLDERMGTLNYHWLEIALGIESGDAGHALAAIPKATASYQLVRQELQRLEAAGNGCP